MESKTFKGKIDRYNGVIINSEQEPCEENEFEKVLADSLTKWREEKRRCIWFNVNIKDSSWIPILAREDFNFHNSRNNSVTLCKWLPTDSTSNLPPSCHTNVGVGGLVFNDKNQVLVVCEQYNELPHWKFPGGYVEKGEDIIDAAIREVMEETGISAEYDYIVTLRHTHNVAFGNSDIYFVVALRAMSETITKCDKEIKECMWIDIDEYLNHKNVIGFNRDILLQAIDLKKRNVKLNLVRNVLSLGTITREYTNLIVEDV